MSIRVVIADDHQILVAALQAMLACEPDIIVVGTAGDGAALLALVAEVKPDVVIMDIDMPGMTGIDATRRLVAEAPSTQVVVLSCYSDKRFVIEAINAGATGYVLKSATANELPRAIRSVAHGQTYLSPDVAGAVVETMRATDKSSVRAAAPRLGPRERMIVGLLAEGKSSAQIAAQLNIALSTVDTHRRNIMHKLDVHNLAELTRYAIREGLTIP